MSSRILIVEDERDTRELLGRALGRAGYACSLYATADAVLDEPAVLESIDAVLTDVVIGSDDRRGLRFLTELRQVGCRVPVLIMTAYADVDKVKFALNEGAAHLIEKPFEVPELVAAIERVLTQEPGTAAEDLFERAHLTDKERRVARHLLAGFSSNEIAAHEKNSPKTIRQHITQIYLKCDVANRAEFFRLMYRR